MCGHVETWLDYFGWRSGSLVLVGKSNYVERSKWEMESGNSTAIHRDTKYPEPLVKELLPLDRNEWKSWRVRYKIGRVLQLNKKTSKAVVMLSG